MPIYDRAQSASRMLRGQSIGLLGTGQPERLPSRPEIPQVSVGNVDFLGGALQDRATGQAQQQQVLGNLLQLGQLGVAGYGAYQGGGLGRARSADLGQRQFTSDPGYILSYYGY